MDPWCRKHRHIRRSWELNVDKHSQCVRLNTPKSHRETATSDRNRQTWHCTRPSVTTLVPLRSPEVVGKALARDRCSSGCFLAPISVWSTLKPLALWCHQLGLELQPSYWQGCWIWIICLLLCAWEHQPVMVLLSSSQCYTLEKVSGSDRSEYLWAVFWPRVSREQKLLY